MKQKKTDDKVLTRGAERELVPKSALAAPAAISDDTALGNGKRDCGRALGPLRRAPIEYLLAKEPRGRVAV